MKSSSVVSFGRNVTVSWEKCNTAMRIGVLLMVSPDRKARERDQQRRRKATLTQDDWDQDLMLLVARVDRIAGFGFNRTDIARISRQHDDPGPGLRQPGIVGQKFLYPIVAGA